LSELHWLSIAELGSALRRREVSAAEALAATRRRIEATEPRARAYVATMDESADAEAARADAELAKRRSRGPLHGVPIAVKDLCCTAGFPTAAGSRVLDGFVPAEDATVVARLREGGAVIVGKTVTHEFAYGQDVPPTRNAWAEECYPGGSSAGSAVATAVGSAYGAIGTDTAGSIRVPAAMNGVVGLKPTYGRVGRRGVIPMSPTLDTVGPLTRTVADAALILSVIAGADQRDATAIDELVPDYASARLTDDLRGFRVGLERDFFFYPGVAPDVRTAVDAAIGVLEDLGATVVDVAIPDLEHVVDAGMTVLLADTSEWHQAWLRARGDRYVRETRVMLELGELVSATSYVKAQKIRTVVQRSVRSVFESQRLDALAAPTVPVTTMPVGDLSRRLTGSGETALSALVHHCFLANLVGLPALSMPVGFDRGGLPVGMQLHGRPFGEPAIIALGRSYQQATDWHERVPP
jgi:aspartyl-tRNA(Asn)/glutamyl-tRNA(Gln) amidotransferase subunit A